MDIKVKKAGNFDCALISVVPNKLNLKLGCNGLGKTTIGKAISAQLNNPDKLTELKKYGSQIIPTVDIPDLIKTCMIFDKQYIDNCLYKNDVINNTYELVVKTPNYEQKKNEIEGKLNGIISLVSIDQIQQFITTVESFSTDISFTGNHDVDSRTKFGKGYKSGNFDQLITDLVEPYRKYILSDKVASWSKWFKEADSVIIDETECPFCLGELNAAFPQQRNQIKATFDNTVVKNNITSKEILGKFTYYSTPMLKSELREIAALTTQIPNHKARLIESHLEILKNEKDKLNRLKSLSPIKLLDNLKERTLKTYLEQQKLNTSLFEEINENMFQLSVDINTNIEQTIKIIDDLIIGLGALNSVLSSNIDKALIYVNEFLTLSGIPYEIAVLPENNTIFKTVLRPKRQSEVIVSSSSLSYGEFNAISLILFSIEANAKKPDLVILDDPVSSFDTNKKYAIFHHLFKSSRHENFCNKTVLLLTHDLVPVIDLVYIGRPSRDLCVATYLVLNNNDIQELEISKDCLMNIVKSEEANSKDSSINMVSRLVHLRKYLELTNKLNTPEYHLISSFLKHSEKPYWRISDENNRDLTEVELREGQNSIRMFIKEFDYDVFIKNYSNNDVILQLYLTSADISKIHLTRFYGAKNGSSEENKILWKYIDESYHIENDYLYSLNQYHFNQIPNYIIAICDKIMQVS